MATKIAVATQTDSLSAQAKRFFMLVEANFVMYIRNRAAMFWVVLFPIGLMLVLGAIYGNKPFDPTNPDSLTAISFITPGLVVLSLMSNGLVGNAGAMANFREKGILRRVQTTPLPVLVLIVARVVMQACLSLGQAALLLGVSVVAFNAHYDISGLLEALPFVILGSVVFMALGQAITAVVRKVETVQVVTQAVNFPLMFLGSLWIPSSAMPAWLQQIGNVLPSTLVANLVRTPMLRGMDLVALRLEPNIPFWVCLGGVIVYLVAAIAVSARFFKWS